VAFNPSSMSKVLVRATNWLGDAVMSMPAIRAIRQVFPHAWLWQVYGGWRGHHHVALEPWTGHPMQLEEAQAAGRARILQPGESLETDVAFALYSGIDAVSAVQQRADGFAVR